VFDSVRGVLIFLEFAVLVAPLATSFLDAAAVVLTGWGHGYLPISAERFWTNALAELTIVPSIVLCSVNYVRWIRKAGLPRACEASLLFLCTVLVTFLIFGLHPISAATAPALLYVPILLLLWATARFGSGGLSLSLLLISLTSIWYVTHGHQPFPYASLAQNILSLQILLCVVALPLMFLSAILTEARHTQESLRGITADLIEAQEQERRRIARELHDGLSQQLSLAQVKLSTLIEESNESLKPGLAEVSGELSAVSIEAHEISHGLYPSVLEYLGLARALEKLRDEASAGKLQILLRIGNLPRQLPAAISLCLYRIAQEALRNAIKHSQADHFQLEVGAQSGHIFLRVDDDGVGFDIRGEGTGLGLNSMRQRVRSVGGTIDIRSYWKKGTRIEVRVPFAEHRADNIAGVA
jgi:signal transduction histidine kinase